MERASQIFKDDNVALRVRLAELSRHCVYGFFDKNKKLMYAGQTTDLNWRVSQHLGLATGKLDQSNVRLLNSLKIIIVIDKIVS